MGYYRKRLSDNSDSFYMRRILMARFFTSDQHLACPPSVYYILGRKFSLEEHDYVIAQNWDDVVGPDDEVYILGDIVVSDNVEIAVPLLSKMNGKKILVPGHHDGVDKVGRKLYEEAGVEILNEKNPVIVFDSHFGPVNVRMSHFPYAHENSENYYSASYVPFTEPHLPLLHGHRHHNTPFNPFNVLEYNVSVDANDFKPVPERVIFEWLDKLHRNSVI
jgi:calcineurin-like phosphoesterase family protein